VKTWNCVTHQDTREECIKDAQVGYWVGVGILGGLGLIGWTVGMLRHFRGKPKPWVTFIVLAVSVLLMAGGIVCAVVGAKLGD